MENRKGNTMISLLIGIVVMGALTYFSMRGAGNGLNNSLKDNKNGASLLSLKNDARNAKIKQESIFISAQTYDVVYCKEGEDDENGICYSDNDHKFVVSKDNTLEVNEIDCDNRKGYEIRVSNKFTEKIAYLDNCEGSNISIIEE